MGKAAKIVSKLGFDGIDINMGCPVREVIRHGAGAGLIGNYETSGAIIAAVKKGAGKIPVSVKTRLGLNINIAKDWCTFLLKQDIAALTVHGRTAKQMSKVPADWEEIGKIVKIRNIIAPQIPIVGNGDVKNYKEVLGMHKKFGVDGVMIGRGIFANPWVFDKSANPKIHTKKDYINLLFKHMELFESTWGESKNFNIIKKFFKMYINNFHGASILRQKLMETNSFEEIKKILSE
jgi:tRNA-dihydrouridine synthase